MSDILNRLADLLEQRKTAQPDTSYVAKLYSKGMDSILKKVGEEATETIIAAKGSFVYGLGLLWIYALGHCLLILIAGTSMGAAKVLIQHKHLNRTTEIVRKISGILIIFVGLYFLIT